MPRIGFTASRRTGRLQLLHATIVLGAMLLPAVGLAADAAAPIEIRLDNGLRIFVLERPTSPTFAAYYEFGVGGASDPRGKSGIAHLLEHMMFKGTTSVGTLDAAKEARLMQRLRVLWHELDTELAKSENPFATPDDARIQALRQGIDRVSAEQEQLIVANEYDEIYTRAGAVGMNASTNHDITNYYVQLPSNRLELWFRMESDRLRNPVFREFWSERDVVHEERRLSAENQAEGRVREALQSLLYQAHAYGTPVLGWPRDIRHLKEDDALNYFRLYYSPSNCIMAIAGEVRAAEVERLARKHLAAWKRQEIPPLDITAEPEQKGERRQIIEFEAEPSLHLAWATVPIGHPDEYALDVLADILGGLRSSRLDRSLVEHDKSAARVAASHPTRRWAGYLSVSAYPRPEHDVAELERGIDEAIQRIALDGVTGDELDRAKIQVEVDRVRGLKTNISQALRVARSVGITGHTRYFDDYEQKLNVVTAAQVREACTKYLLANRKCVVEVHNVVGAGKPDDTADAGHHRGGEVTERGAKHSRGFRDAMALAAHSPPLELRVPEAGKDFERVVLPSGVTVFVKEDRSAPSIDLAFSWLGGANTLPVDRLAPWYLASRLLSQGGTEVLTPAALDERMEELGMTFNLFIGGTQSGATFWSLKRNFDAAYAVAMDMLMHPRFDAERLEVVRGRFIDQWRRRYDSPGQGAQVLRQHVLYRDHPRLGYVPSRDEIERVTPDDIRRLWRRYLGRDNLYVTAVGDFDRREMLDRLERTFASWRTSEDRQRDFLAREPVERPGLFVVEKEVSAPSVHLVHQMRADRTLPLADHAALEVLNDILGGSGFRSRLVERLRSDEGLTYGIGSFLFHDGRPGVPGEIGVSYQTKKASVARSIDAVISELQKAISAPFSRTEVEEQIESWRNSFVFSYTNDFVVVNRVMANELDDRPADYDRQLLQAVQKVTPADVERVARQYLRPEALAVCVFGALTDEDRAALAAKFDLEVLTKDEVFRGNYDRAPRAVGGR